MTEPNDPYEKNNEMVHMWLGDNDRLLGPKGKLEAASLLFKAGNDEARWAVSNRIDTVAKVLADAGRMMETSGDKKISANEVAAFNKKHGTAYKEMAFDSVANFVSLNLHDDLKRVNDAVKDSNNNGKMDTKELEAAQNPGLPNLKAKPVSAKR